MNNKIVLKFDSQKKKNSIEVIIQCVGVGLFIFWTRSHPIPESALFGYGKCINLIGL